MKSSWLYRILTGIAMAGTFSVQPASADVLTFNGSNPYGFIDVAVDLTDAQYHSSGKAGEFFITNQNTQNTFAAWCVDIFHPLSAGDSGNYVLVTASSVLGPVRANALGKFATNHLGSVTDATSSGAFQMALWEIVLEFPPPLSISSPRFTADGGQAANDLANLWLTPDANPTPNALTVNIWKSTDSPQLQWLVVFVPEPQSYVMLLAGLGLIGVIARRRYKGAHAAA